MNKILRISFALLGLTLASGCASTRPDTLLAYANEGDSPHNLALIRAATKEEKKEEEANLFVKILVNPSGRGSVAKITAIEKIGVPEPVDIWHYKSVKVPPGNYIVHARCYLPAFTLYFNVPIIVSAGNEYLLECTGNTTDTSKISYRLAEPSERTF